MDHVLVSVLMDLLLGLLCRAVMFSAGELLSGTWAGSCWGCLALQGWVVGGERCTSVCCV